MATTALLSEAVLRGRAYYLVLLDSYLIELQNGNRIISDLDKLLCLKKLIRTLQWEITQGVNNEITTELYRRLILELDGFVGDVLPVSPLVVTNSITIFAGVAGANGLSAYQLAVAQGFTGTLQQWLDSLKVTGATGVSAYQSAVNGGFVGTEAEWLESLKANDRTWVTNELAPIRTDITNIKNENTTQNTSITNLNSFRDNIGIIKDILVETTASGKCKEFLQIVPANNYCHVTISVVNASSTVKTYEFVSGFDALGTDWSILTPELVYNDRGRDFNIEIRKIPAFGALNFGIVIRYRNTSAVASKAIVSVDYAIETPSVGTNFDKFNILTTAEYDFTGITNLFGRKLTLTDDGLNYKDTNNKKFLKEGDILFEAASEFGAEFGAEFGTGGSLATQTYVNQKDGLLQTQINNLGTTYQAISQKNTASGYAGIGADGLIPSIFLPALPGRSTFTVASEAAMLALGSATPTAAVKGDFAIRTDVAATGGEATYVLGDLPAATLANWKKLPNPSGGVSSFNTLTGAVTVNSTNIPEGTNLYFTNARVKAYADLLYATIVHSHSFTEITSKPTTIAGYGLLDAEPKFTKNTAFNNNYGQVSGTVVQGNDQRVLNGQIAFDWGNHANQRYFKYENVTFGVDANTLPAGRSQFTFALNAPFTGPITHFDANGYGLFFNASYAGGTNIAFRTRNGDGAGLLNPWYTLWHTGNLTPSVSSAVNTVAQRDSGGDIFARLFRSEFIPTQTLPTTGFIMGQIANGVGTDNYIRPFTQAQVRTFLGLGSAAYGATTDYALAVHTHPYLLLTGGTLTGVLNGTSANFSGYVTAAGGAGTSDARYKDIKDFDFDLTQLDSVKYYQFEWNKKMSLGEQGKQHWGYLAQEIQKINPHLIMGTEEKLSLNKEELMLLEIIRLKQRIGLLEGRDK